ncbi:TPA: hypothetical protein KDY51_001882 [Vibrio parahaemolyticus]|nr:hypothetical protein [Vibrio parahaemolyticus]
MSVKCIARPKEGESCLITGLEASNLYCYGENFILKELVPAPADGWTYEDLEECCSNFEYDYADVYLGEQWIGSTEI